MASKNAAYYSCKFNRAETIKSHRTLEAAIKTAGDFGMVFERESSTERQVHLMSNNQMKSFPEGSKNHEYMDFKFVNALLELELIVK